LIADYGRAVSTTELTKATGATLGATAHHVRALARHGLIECAGVERVRGAIKTFYAPTEIGREALRRPRIETLVILVGAVSDGSAPRPAVAYFDDIAYDEAHAELARLRPKLLAIAERARRRSQRPGTAAA
jgi:DNA-binding PadR family transcriptional regulator